MKKHLLPHILIISFVFLQTPIIQAAPDVEERIELYKHAIRIDPNLAVVHYNLGIAYYASGMLRETVAANKQAIRLDPDFALAHANLGVAYVAIKDRDSAYEQYKILKRLDSELAKELFDKIDPLEILRYKR